MSSGNFQKAFLNNFTIFITLKGNKIILHQYVSRKQGVKKGTASLKTLISNAYLELFRMHISMVLSDSCCKKFVDVLSFRHNKQLKLIGIVWLKRINKQKVWLWKIEKLEQIAHWRILQMFKRKSRWLEHDYDLKSYMNERWTSQDPKVNQRWKWFKLGKKTVQPSTRIV